MIPVEAREFGAQSRSPRSQEFQNIPEVNITDRDEFRRIRGASSKEEEILH